MSTESAAAVAVRLRAGANALAALGAQRVATALAQASTILREPQRAAKQRERQSLVTATGHSQEMVEWALEQALAPLDAAELLRARESLRAPRLGATPVAAQLTVIVAADNVFTAVVPPVAYALLAGSPTLVKTPHRDDTFMRLFKRALDDADEEVGRHLQVACFSSANEDQLKATLGVADTVCAYGSDATMLAIRAHVQANSVFVAHGHGLGIAYVDLEQVTGPDQLVAASKALALDVAAYDQGGCMSPQAVISRASKRYGARELAEALVKRGLLELARTLPRGPLPAASASAQLDWRARAIAQGELFEGDGFSVSVEGEAAIRPSPGYRNVAVLECKDESELRERLRPLGPHLKCLGVNLERKASHRLTAALPNTLVPRTCPLGAMQTPPLDMLPEGRSPWMGLLRWR